ncbi:30S ribosomal protein S10 [archaeon]|nr:30S ribosomal protein S10 [archaeon]|tara:strand:- start:5735 stop:6046 length:312 start_codon:yes stop_codon:yes gene_type:complete
MQKARISLASADIGQINEICTSIKDIAEKTKVKMFGPVHLPTKRLKHTTRKSPCGDGKASFDNFELRIHKRLIDLAVDERALRLVMRVPIPDEVNVSITVLEK